MPGKLPKMRYQKGSGGTHHRAYVVLNGERHYLGHYDTPEAEEAYHRIVAEWLARGKCPAPPKEEATITECADIYLAYLTEQGGDTPSNLDRARGVTGHLVRLYGRMRAAAFTAAHLRAVREALIKDGLARVTVNERTRVVVRMLKHCASLDLIPSEPYHKCLTLEPLKKGRSAAKETQPVRPVRREDVDKVLDRVNRSVGAMIRLQLLTGARPGEICGLKREDIDTNGAVWTATLKRHKNEWRGKARTLYFGPQAQAILREFFLMRRPGEFLFQPMDHWRKRGMEASTPRRPNQAPTPRVTDRTVSDRYETATYAKAIRRACEAAGIDVWTPHRLRHTAATELRKEYGIEVTRAILGHSTVAASQIYAEADAGVVTKIMSERG